MATSATYGRVTLVIRPAGHSPDIALAQLDAGEREAIVLAQELRGDLLLMDDWEGRREAERRIFARRRQTKVGLAPWQSLRQSPRHR